MLLRTIELRQSNMCIESFVTFKFMLYRLHKNLMVVRVRQSALFPVHVAVQKMNMSGDFRFRVAFVVPRAHHCPVPL